MSDDRFKAWQRFVAALPTLLPWVREGVVVAECASTQDECFVRSVGRPGLLVAAMRQTAGRGQHGRRWEQSPEHGLAVTIGLDAAKFTAPVLSLAAGLAASETVRRWVVGPGAASVGVKWPNDVMGMCPRTQARLKIAGVLVEVRGGLALMGIGLNVKQGPEDFPERLRGRAGSIRMLSEGDEAVSRLDVLGTLVVELGRLLHAAPEALTSLWREHDVLVGTSQEFEHDGRRYRGKVLRIDPAHEIVVQGAGGERRLPAVSTRLVRDEDRSQAPCPG